MDDELISVTEYAALHGVNGSLIRRHLASGRIQGFKVGSQWVVPKDAPFPEDKRVKSGAYRDWRKDHKTKT